MSNRLEAYFTKAEEDRIIHAIREAELLTSGEIRVHVSQKDSMDALKTTKNLFYELRMFNTKHRNGVLLHISLASKNFAIYGDEGIHQVVPENFWDETRNIIQQHCIKGDLVKGICEGIGYVGEQLKTHYQWQINDENELPDEISYD